MGQYVNGKKEGTWLYYYPDGAMEDSTVFSRGNPIGTSLSYYNNGYLKDSAIWDEDGSGTFISWFDNGQPSSAGRYSEGNHMTGVWQFFHNNGQLSSREEYLYGKLVNKKYFNKQGLPIADTTDKFSPAVFNGGKDAWSRYLKRKLFFPDRYKLDNADKAIVVVDFTINEDGTISDINVSAPLHPDFDIIAVKALKQSPPWIPAISHNRKVKYFMRQPFSFTQDR